MWHSALRWNYTTRASHTNQDSDGNRLLAPWSFKQTFSVDRKRGGLAAVIISRNKVESKERCVEGSDGYWCLPRGWIGECYVRELTSRLVCSLRLSALLFLWKQSHREPPPPPLLLLSAWLAAINASWASTVKRARVCACFKRSFHGEKLSLHLYFVPFLSVEGFSISLIL